MYKSIFIFIFAFILYGCAKTVYVPVESIRTQFEDRYIRDSIYVIDSIYTRDKGDTIIIEKWRTKFVEKLRVDSFIKVDSIQIPYPIEKELTKWQKIKIELGGWLFGFFILSALGIIIWVFKRK